jgi:hypothetical protein
VLDASQPQTKVARQASTVILDFLHERYLRRRHLWFGTDNWHRANCQAALSPLTRLDEEPGISDSAPDPYGQPHPIGGAGPFGLVALHDGRGYLVPLESRRAAAMALTLYNPQTRKARIGRSLLRAGLRLGVAQPFLRRVWPPFAGEQHSPQAHLLAYLQDLVGQGRLTFAISLGTPGPHRKPVVQMMDAQGHILGYAKIGHDAASNALVQNETRVLQELATAPWQALALPQVLATGWWQGHCLCVLSAPHTPCRRLPQRLTPLHVAALRELWTMQMEWMPLSSSPFWMTLVQHVEQVEDPYYRSTLEQGMANAEKWLAKHPLPFHFCHGDFTPWNLQRERNKLFLVDWECAAKAGPPMWDLCHFIFQTLFLVRHQDAAHIVSALTGHDPGQWPGAAAWRDLGLKEIPPQSLVLLYCLERLAFWARTASRPLALLRTLSVMINLLVLES